MVVVDVEDGFSWMWEFVVCPTACVDEGFVEGGLVAYFWFVGVSIDYGVCCGGVFVFLVVLFLYYLVYCFVFGDVCLLSNGFAYSVLDVCEYFG